MLPTDIKKLWDHRVLVTVSLTETGAAQSLRLRTAWLVFAVIFALSGWLGMVLAGDLAGARLTAALTGNNEMKYYLDMIAELRAQRDAEREQMRTIAQQLGVLQARLDRFDALGNKLKAEGTIFTEAPGTEGKGGVEIPLPKTLPSLDDLKKQLGTVTDRADFAEVALETEVAMAIRSSFGAGAGGAIPYLWPLITETYRASSPFGWRQDPIHGSRAFHAGMDLADKVGGPVVAAADGVVAFTGWRMGYGNLVEIKHEKGFTTRYGHLYKIVAKEGQRVNGGDLVALLGNSGRSTGPHLHFEVRKDDNPLNPLPFVKDTRLEVMQMARNGRGQELLSQWKAGNKSARR